MASDVTKQASQPRVRIPFYWWSGVARSAQNSDPDVHQTSSPNARAATAPEGPSGAA